MPTENKINENLATQSYWDESYNSYLLNKKVPNDDVIKKWILNHIPKTSAGNCIEIGCFPGRYLTVLGDLGYELNGIDLTPRVKEEFGLWLANEGYRVGTFYHENFLEFKSMSKFNIVCSFGFIEHFTNWKDIFEKHRDLVEKDGFLIIETPNFRGWLQKLIHRFLDYENYKRHYIPSMSPIEWKMLCEKKGFEIVFQGYIGEFDFWVDKRPNGYVKNKIIDYLNKYSFILKKIKSGKKSYSPYCGIIAKRKT